MTATAARTAFILNQFRRAVSETTTVKTQYGALARQSDDPIPTFFDTVADAQAMADERQGLLNANRRRFTATVQGVDEAMALTYSGNLPVATYTDPDRAISGRAMLVTDIVIDFDKQSAALTIWG